MLKISPVWSVLTPDYEIVGEMGAGAFGTVM